MKKLLLITSIFLGVIISAQNFTIVLDAGHGGDDKGAEVAGFSESEYNLEFTNMVAQELKKFENIKVIETRTSDESISLDERINIVNQSKPNLLVSFHLNSGNDPSVNGIDIWYPKNHDQSQSKTIGETLAQTFPQFGLADRGVQEAGFKLINEAESPAVLIDLGYITNEHDRNILESEKVFLAKAVAKSLLMISIEN